LSQSEFFFTTRGYSWDKKPVNDRYSISNASSPTSMTTVDGLCMVSSPSQSSSRALLANPHPSPSLSQGLPNMSIGMRRPSLPYRKPDLDTSTRARTPSSSTTTSRSLPEPLVVSPVPPSMIRMNSAHSTSGTGGRDRLPHIAKLHPHPQQKVENSGSNGSQEGAYVVPLSPEDRRLLNSFNLRL